MILKEKIKIKNKYFIKNKKNKNKFVLHHFINKIKKDIYNTFVTI
jgi:hypothetical protein